MLNVAQSGGDYQLGNGGNQGVGPEFYYSAVDGIVFNNGSTLSRNDFVFTFNFMAQANARYIGFENGKHHINFSVGDYEVTTANIQALVIHEAFGHGVMNYGDDLNNHRMCYFAEVNSMYWEATTLSYKQHTLKWMGIYNSQETNGASFPSMYIHNQYVKYYPFK